MHMNEIIHVPVEGGSSPKKSHIVIWIAVVLVLVLGAYATYRNYNNFLGARIHVNQNNMTELEKAMTEAQPTPDQDAIAVAPAWISNFETITYDYSGVLSDVSGGDASGRVSAGMVDGVYHLYARFADLPKLEDDYFYEGWLVRMSPLDIVSTGELSEHNGTLVNTYLSREDLFGHKFYVLTLEPRDNDLAPAKHILEGVMMGQ